MLRWCPGSRFDGTSRRPPPARKEGKTPTSDWPKLSSRLSPCAYDVSVAGKGPVQSGIETGSVAHHSGKDFLVEGRREADCSHLTDSADMSWQLLSTSSSLPPDFRVSVD